MDYRERVATRIDHFPDAFRSHGEMLAFLKQGRSPTKQGRKVNSNTRLFLRDGNVIEVQVHKTRLATISPDDIVTFTATPRQVWDKGSSIAWTLHKTLPVWVRNFDKGRYKVIVKEDLDTVASGPGSYYDLVRPAQSIAQEYFQHLKLDLKTGKIINRKDMTPTVNEDKRKQWLTGLKKFRVQLRVQARVGALEGRFTSYQYLDSARTKHLADCIMTGQPDNDAIQHLIDATGTWRARNHTSYGDAVVVTFENFVKSNSRELRVMAGVLDIE